MRRKAGALMVAFLGGCVSLDGGPEHGGGSVAPWAKQGRPNAVPGVMGPNGEPVAMAAPYNAAPPGSAWSAHQMMAQSVPLNMVQPHSGGMMPPAPGMPPMAMPPGLIGPPGFPAGPGAPGGMRPPGAGPQGGVVPTGGFGSPGGGVMPAFLPPGAASTGGVMQAQFAPGGAGLPSNSGIRFPASRTQVRFVRPTGMKVQWFARGADNKPAWSTVPLEAPARYNFAQGAVYRLKLSNIEGHPGREIYPTMEVVPGNPKTEAFLAHSAVPLEFTNEDLKQIADGNYVVKVIYLPDPQFQDAAGAGIDEILSTRLEPGADPIQEALRRGSILLILRMGNVDQEAPNTPPLSAPVQGAPQPSPAFGPQFSAPPGFQVPYGMLPPGARPGIPAPPGAFPPPGSFAPGGSSLPPGSSASPAPSIPPPNANPLIPGNIEPGKKTIAEPSAPVVPPPASGPGISLPPPSIPSAPPGLPGLPGLPGVPAPQTGTPPTEGPARPAGTAPQAPMLPPPVLPGDEAGPAPALPFVPAETKPAPTAPAPGQPSNRLNQIRPGVEPPPDLPPPAIPGPPPVNPGSSAPATRPPQTSYLN